MHKKIISIIISLVLIACTFACPSFAESAQRTVLYEENFENFTTKSFNTGFTTSGNNYSITDSGEIARLNVGNFFETDIVEMTGYNGQTTEAVKITGNPNASGWDSTAGQARITFSGLSGKLSEITSGTIVYEMKMYVPADINSGGEAISQSLGTMVMSPIIKYGDMYAVGSATDKRTNIATLTKGEWHKLTYVLLLDESRVLVYHNDVLASYKVREVSSKGYRFQVISKAANEGSHIILDDIKVWHTEGSLSKEGLTGAFSTLDGAVDVSRHVKPQVEFSEMLLDKVTDSGATVSAANVEMATSDGAPVAIDSVSLSADKKTLTINPADELSWSTVYKVKFKNLLNVYQEKIADYEISFKVMDEPPYASVEPVFTKLNDFTTPNQPAEEISFLENGYINANYAIINNHDSDEKDVFMFAVLRDSGALKAIEFKQTKIKPRQTLEFNAGFEIDDYTNQSIEIYIWDNLTSRNALVPSYVITKDGIETTAQ